jgi:hypothetical protein
MQHRSLQQHHQPNNTKDQSSNIVSRKIDMKLIGDEDELCYSEFKTRAEEIYMEKQLSKGLRLNKIIIKV